MSKRLVIVESPSKSKTIESYLGKEYKVLSSKGHIRDLATTGPGGLGIDVENDFKPNYKLDKEKKKVVDELQKAIGKVDEVYLATDPDREGEAISWHLAQVLDIDLTKKNRVVFNEITKDAVLSAIEQPRVIDMDLVKSQETRRMLDRIIGFKLSKLLQNKIQSKSAGRVQSVALKLIVDREREIDAFIPEEYWSIKAFFNIENKEFEADLNKYKNKKIKITNEQQAKEVFEQLTNQFLVESVKKTAKNKQSKLPYTTSTLQQDSSSKLGFSAKRTMSVAQTLYEGIELDNETVGLITYMRTDSTRLSPVFIDDAKTFIEKEYGKKYLGNVKVGKKKENVQDAHEAIRPTSVLRTPESVKAHLTNDQFKLYSMVYARAVASLMASAKFETTSIGLNNHDYLFNASGSIQKFDGYLKVYGPYEKNTDDLLPSIEENQTIESEKIDLKQHFTKPPARYSEAKLIKEMEELGIGRPSTYAQTIDNIKQRGYVDYTDKSFKPTEQGILTTDKLQEFFFDVINVDYTAKMENNLDAISEGKENNVEALKTFYNHFIPMVDKAYEQMEKLAPVPTGELCPDCGEPLVIRNGRYGKFTACSNYPTCKHIKKEEKTVETTGETCPNCGSDMIKKNGRFGQFEACSNYPSCKYIKKKPSEYPKKTDEICEKCGSEIVIKRGRYGEFKACSNYPKCKNIIKMDD